MDKATVMRAFGRPEVLEDVTVAPPAAGDLLARQTAIAVNFHDTYVRSGLYKTLALPGTPSPHQTARNRRSRCHTLDVNWARIKTFGMGNGHCPSRLGDDRLKGIRRRGRAAIRPTIFRRYYM